MRNTRDLGGKMAAVTEAAIPLDPEQLLAETEWLRALAVHLVHDPGAADDVAQDAAIAAWRRPPTGERRPWLAAIARNLARQRHRSESRRERREERAARGGDAPSPAEMVERVEMHRLLAELVAGLSEPNRTAVVMRYYEALAHAEIARRLGVPSGTVRARVHRGLAELRERLDERNRGERSVWMTALAPLVRRPEAPAGSSAGLVVAATGVAAIVVTAWVVFSDGSSAASPVGGQLTASAPATSGPRRSGSAAVQEAAPATPSPPGFRVRGRVIAPPGASPDGAVVTAVAIPPGAAARSVADRLLATVAAADTPRGVAVAGGRFDVAFDSRSPVRLTASAPGLASAPVDLDGTADRDDVDLVLEPAVRFRGRVFDATGVAVEGARVAYVLMPAPWRGEEARVRAVATTAADGRFALDLCDPAPLGGTDDCHGLLVTRAGFASVTASLGDPDAELGIVLPRGTTITGRVLAADGSPSSAAVVTVIPARDMTSFGAIGVSAETAADGTFRVGPVGDETPFTFSVLVAPRGGLRFVTAQMKSGSGEPLEVRLPGVRVVSGRVVEDETGSGTAGVAVRVVVRQPAVRDAWPSMGVGGVVLADSTVTSHDDGAFEFAVPDGPHVSAGLRVSGPVWWLAKGPGSLDFGVTGKPVPEAPELRVRRCTSIAGEVVDEAGNPVAGATVHLSSARAWNASPSLALTGPDGRFHADGVPGATQDRWVVARAPGHGDGAAGPLTPKDTSNVAGLRIVLGPVGRTIRGSVEDALGRPVAGAEIICTSIWPPVRATTAPDGSWSLAGIPDGCVSLTARRAGHLSCVCREVPVGPETTSVPPFVLAEPYVLRGVVADETGARVPGAQVVIVGDDGSTSSVTCTGPDGTFEFGGVASRELSLWIGRAAFSFVREPVRITAPPPGELRVMLRRARTISGRVTESDGRPLAHARIGCQRESDEQSPGGAAATVTDENGSFVLDGLVDGRFELRIGNESAHPPVAADTSGLLWVLAPPRAIRGAVFDPAGQALSGVSVAFHRTDLVPRNSKRAAAASPTSGPDGRFEVTTFRDGVYDVILDAPQFAFAKVPNVRPGDTAVEIRLVAGREISGVVTDAEGRPLAGANVVAAPRAPAEGVRSARSDATGSFTIRALADGEFDVRATAVVTAPKRVVLKGESGPVAAGASDVKLVVVPAAK